MIVLDCSAVLVMCFEDEDERYAERLFDYFVDATAIAPEIWPLMMVAIEVPGKGDDSVSSA